ncbi:hypothetical protein CFOL_v3_11380 [Cephalotus follicularis]|uniref:Transmembrane protein n=1 Tax=Cephalotus follicularis TaxID=3775 RepID=A0A1Q3BIL2_CEPFO|nr:hypothetical protein CFOL_v3_11380 [Cephalotus follicularis]
MSDHPRLNRLRSTAAILKQASATFTANTFTFLFLSLLIFSFRSLVENGTHHITSFIDRDASLKSLLTRLDLSHHPHHHQHRRRRPFLHLTRVGTLDDDFFSGDEDLDRSLFNPVPKNPPNATLLILSGLDSKLGFSDSVVDNGIKFLETVRPGITFKIETLLHIELDGDSDDKEDNHEQGEEDKNRVMGLENERELDRIMDLHVFIKGLELGRRDAATLFFLVSFLSAAYGWVILGFTAIYSWVLGIVFVTVVNEMIGRRFNSFVGVVWDGSRLGLKRLTGFILMRWAVRDALTQLLGLWYFGEIQDQYSFFKLFLRLKLMPFSIMSPWIRGFEKEISGFLFAWVLLDTLLALILAVDAWVAVVDTRRSGREIVKEGCYLIWTMLNEAMQLKCVEAIFCGSFARWFLSRVCGRTFAAVFQSTVEVYFMVAWLIYYFAARYRDANAEGRRFGRRELEGLINGLR